MLGAYEVNDVLHMHGMIVSLNVDLGGPETAHADACGVGYMQSLQTSTTYRLLALCDIFLPAGDHC